VSFDVGAFSASARWQFGTGLPFTRPMGYDESLDYRFTMQNPSRVRGETRLLLEKPYLARLPVFHRLDVSLERRIDSRLGGLRAELGAINVYDRTNIFFYDVYTHRRLDQLPFVPYASLRLEAR
jgi:hypothetical protein